MQHRNLIHGRLGGRLIASHIRIPNGGRVADYVHHHHVRIQMINCYKGWVRVVYEDQGEPFAALLFILVIIVPLLSYDEPKISLIQTPSLVRLLLTANR